MKKTAFIAFLVLLGWGHSFAQQTLGDRLKSEGKEDVHSLSSADYPYIDQFHNGVREMLAGNDDEAKKWFQKCLSVRQNDDAVYYALAEIARKKKNTINALDLYQKAYTLDATNSTYLKNLAELYFDKGDYEKAAPLFRQLCKHDPRNPDYRFGYSKTLIYLKLYKEAINQLNQLQELTGVVPQLQLMEADLYSELKEYDKQEALLLRLKSNYSDNKKVLNALIRFYDKQGDEEKAYTILEDLLKNNPTNGMAQIILAKDYLKQENIKAFLQLAPKLFQNKNVSIDHKLFFLKRYKGLKGPTSPETQKIIEQLYAENADNATVALDYGRLLIAQHNSTKALEVFRKAIQAHKSDYSLWSQVLLFEEDYWDYEALYKDGNAALDLFPSMPFIYYEASKGALATGHPQEAQQILDAGEMYLVDDNKEAAKFSMRKGEIYFSLANYKKGIVAFEKGLSLSDAALIKVTYATNLAKYKIAPDVAGQLLAKVSNKDKNRDFYRASAMLLINKNKWEAAADILTEGIDNVFNNAELYDLLGDCYSQINEPAKALAAWKKAKEFASKNKNIDKKIKEGKYYAPKYL